MSTNPQIVARESTGMPVTPPTQPSRPERSDAPATPPLPEVRAAWPRYVALWLAVVAVLLGALHKDVAHLVSRWWNSETYGHCLLILPIVGWLIWQRREPLLRIAPRPWAPGVLLVLGAGLVWLVGELGGAAVLRHAGIVLMVIATVPTVFGAAVGRGLLFPLFFMIFLIPVGEQLEGPMQTVTAQFATWLLRVCGVPTHMDGVFISIPNGDFEVAQACSGVRFLIAMVAFGALVANVCFKSWKRRAVFMAFAIALPIISNGIRVWGTIYAAHLTTPEVARGIDHVVYGWVFFALVMVILLAASWKWFDRPVEDKFIDADALQAPGTLPAPLPKAVSVAAAAAALGVAAPVWGATVSAAGPGRPTVAVQITPPPGWTSTGYRGFQWKPIYFNATAEQFVHLTDGRGQPVDVYIAVYDRQHEDHELIRFGQGIIEEKDEGGWAWAANQTAPQGAAASQINYGPIVRDAVQYYWVNGKLTGSRYDAKLEGLKARLFGGESRAATLVVSAQRGDGLTSARPEIDRFINAVGPVDGFIGKALVEGEPQE